MASSLDFWGGVLHVTMGHRLTYCEPAAQRVNHRDHQSAIFLSPQSSNPWSLSILLTTSRISNIGLFRTKVQGLQNDERPETSFPPSSVAFQAPRPHENRLGRHYRQRTASHQHETSTHQHHTNSYYCQLCRSLPPPLPQRLLIVFEVAVIQLGTRPAFQIPLLPTLVPRFGGPTTVTTRLWIHQTSFSRLRFSHSSLDRRQERPPPIVNPSDLALATQTQTQTQIQPFPFRHVRHTLPVRVRQILHEQQRHDVDFEESHFD